MPKSKTTNALATSSHAALRLDAVPTADKLAEVLGVAYTASLDPRIVRAFRKPLPGYVTVLDDAAELVARDGVALGATGVTPSLLISLKAQRQHLAACEAVVDRLARSVYEQRMQVDDAAIGALQKVARFVRLLADDDATLLERWASVLAYLQVFTPGRPSDTATAAAPTPVIGSNAGGTTPPGA